MSYSATNYNWIPDATNSTYEVTDSNHQLIGTIGTVDTVVYISGAANIPVANASVVAVNTYNLTNTTWWLNEF